MMDSPYYNAKDVALITGKSTSHAYKIIQELNKELKEKGYLIIHGRVPKKYFSERFMI